MFEIQTIARWHTRRHTCPTFWATFGFLASRFATLLCLPFRDSDLLSPPLPVRIQINYFSSFHHQEIRCNLIPCASNSERTLCPQPDCRGDTRVASAAARSEGRVTNADLPHLSVCLHLLFQVRVMRKAPLRWVYEHTLSKMRAVEAKVFFCPSSPHRHFQRRDKPFS